MNEQCCGSVRGEKLHRRYTYHQCGANAKVEREGKFYCLRHDPQARKAKQDVRYAAFLAECKANSDRVAFVAACEQLVRNIGEGRNFYAVADCEKLLAHEFNMEDYGK